MVDDRLSVAGLDRNVRTDVVDLLIYRELDVAIISDEGSHCEIDRYVLVGRVEGADWRRADPGRSKCALAAVDDRYLLPDRDFARLVVGGDDGGRLQDVD